MKTQKLTKEEVAALCATPEDHFHDRKSARIAPAKLSKTMSAFANADGGELVVGVEDDGTWAGAPTVEDYNGHLQALEPLFPYGSEFDYQLVQHPSDGTVGLVLAVQKSRDIRYATNGTAYLRRGAQSLPVADIEDLRRKKGLTTHETATLRYSPVQLVESEVIADFIKNVVPHTNGDNWLRKQNLIVDDLPTVAGTVLFHDEPQIHLPKAALKLYRYTTSDEEGSREHLAYTPITFDGCLYKVIGDAVAETVRQVEEMPILEKGSGLTRVHYPQEALHEIITNALIHRDYAVNDDVHVRIFENRIEVQSPGSLPANITPQNILDERFARNPMIVRLLNKFPNPPNQDVGEGLNTAFAAMRKLDLRDPDIVDTGTSVVVVIRHETLAAPESRIVDYLKINGTINNREARALLNRPEADRSVRRLFEKLAQADVIERVPGTIKGGSRYRLLEGGSSGDATSDSPAN